MKRCTGLLPANQSDALQRFARLLEAWYHHRLHSDSEALKRSYRQADAASFAQTLASVVEAANFQPITEDDLQQALQEESMFSLRLSVDFADFDQHLFYGRGHSLEDATVKRWFGLSERQIRFENFELVLIYVRFRALRSGEDPAELKFTPGDSILKVFRNVPKADLEMLLPNTRIHMRLIDKLLIGVPAFFSGVIMLSTKLGGTLLILFGLAAFYLGMGGQPVTLDQGALIALLSGAATLGAYLWKQYSNFKNRKLRFMQTLTQNLYFKTLAHNEGVLSFLVDHAEESEVKEMLLAYTALTVLGAAGREEIQAWVEAHVPEVVCFDIDDALAKLDRVDLLQGAPGRFEVPAPDQAFALLDARWDALFAASDDTAATLDKPAVAAKAVQSSLDG